MADLPNARIPELPPITTMPNGGLVPLYNPLTGVTGHFDLSTMLPSSGEDARWISTYDYGEGEIVTYGGKLYQSLQSGNTGHIPNETDSEWWTVISKAPSGLVSWQAGVFLDDDAIVLTPKDDLNILGVYGMFRLVNPTRPYNSADLFKEWAAGDWELLDNTKFIAVSDPANTRTEGMAATFKGGEWAEALPEDLQLGIFKVSEGEYFIVELFTNFTKIPTALTPGVIYYVQPDSTIGTAETDAPVFIAVSDELGVIIPAKNGVGGGFAILDTYADIPELLSEQADQLVNGWYMVQDATADPTVGTGWAIYQKLVATTGSLSDYLKIAEGESLDVQINDASPTQKGIAKLYNVTGANTDGAITQGAVTTALGGKQNTLGYTPENVTNKENTTLDNSTTKYPTNRLVKEHIDDLQGQIDDLGGYTSTPPSVLFGAIVGEKMMGKTLTARWSFEDVDGTPESGSTIQWYYADDVAGTNEVLIAGATSFTQVLSDAGQIGKCPGFKITPRNSAAETGSVFTYYSPETVSAKLYPGDGINAISASSVKAVISIKKMFTAYAGFCMQLTTNGSNSYDVGFSGDDANWAGAVTWSGGAQTYLRIGYDQSGNGNNLVFANFAAMPKVDLVNKFIQWEPTKTGNCGAAASLNLGLGNYSIFAHVYIDILKDCQLTVFQKQTNFSSAHVALQSAPGVDYPTYSGNGAPSLRNYKVPLNRWDLLMMGRDGTNRYFKAKGLNFQNAEVNNDVTSTGNLLVNSGSNGGGGYVIYYLNLRSFIRWVAV